MKIAVMNATSQKEKNAILYESVQCAVKQADEVINLGLFQEDDLQLSYVQVALCVGILLNSKAVDFVVTGCSSG